MSIVYIGNAVGDEHGHASGGEPGNQTGKELRIQPWYKSAKGWLVFRPKSEEVAQKLVYDMKAACNNPNIGYDQKQRNTLYNAAKSVGFDCAKVSEPCECDCSSLVRVCLAYAGMPIKDFSTASEPSRLIASGQFDELDEPEYTESSKRLKAGDVLCTAIKGHTAIVLNDGPDADEPQPEPPEPDPPELKWYVEVIAKSVRVRKGDGTFSKTVFIAHNADWYRKQGIQHGNDLLPYVGPAPSGWYQINSDRGDGYITNKAKYTRLVEL